MSDDEQEIAIYLFVIGAFGVFILGLIFAIANLFGMNLFEVNFFIALIFVFGLIAVIGMLSL